MPRAFSILTFGCKSNQYDSQLWRKVFEQAGWHESSDSPDVWLVNSCAVTAAAERQARQAVRRARREAPGSLVIVAGCAGDVDAESFGRMKEADLVVGRYGPPSVTSALRFLGAGHAAGPSGIDRFAGQTRAFLKIQDGCSHACAYCIVPRARGASRSRDLAEAVAEAVRLLDSGHREIVVTGIRLGDYRPSLSLALAALAGLPGLARIRISSLEPDDVADQLIETISRHPVIARHLHLPLQSGSDRMLKAMGRPYGIGRYRELLERISRRIPGMTFGTDLMVGFPGESEEDFRASLEAALGLPISHLHVFSYSRRPGTRAAAMGGQIPEAVKRERSQRLREAFSEKQHKLWHGLVGARETVLFETGRDGRWSGMGEHYFRVFADSPDDLHNRLRSVLLTSVQSEGLTGEVGP
jgi:threonylcarbamoyladenosine tRNA methylthiotransferase MtaB